MDLHVNETTENENESKGAQFPPADHPRRPRGNPSRDDRMFVANV